MEQYTVMEETIKRIMKMLGVHFGVNSEFILHDMRSGLESTVVAIENNGLTGRNIGDCSSNLGLELLRYEGKSEINDSYGYHIYFKGGKVFRASTMFFKDQNGKIIGSFCINTDITPLIGMQSYIDNFAPKEKVPQQVDEFFPRNVSEMLDTLIERYKEKVQKSPEEMTKEEKLDAVRYFDSKGAFLITRANSKLCKYLGISKGTLYSYLAIVRENEEV